MMKQVYANLQPSQGLQKNGFCSIQITPREWLQNPIAKDFDTDKIVSMAKLRASRFWISLSLTRDSYKLVQLPKDTKSGNYYEISLSGTLNTYNYALRQVLESLRHHEMVAILYDKYGQRILAGNESAGLRLQVAYEHTSGTNGKEYMTLTLAGEFENLAPFYNPDNAPDLPENYLVNNDGNYILVG